ncbi:Unknown protein [Striga hermonthica]|uniref:Uncharacterized protein n=1 Tax=Striga hermonthica TaxID=68872 RepID=A0A9N7NGJ8_STRHE|nr:Unknown protein [Striga hermonthica]
MKVPIFVISSVAEELMAFTSIIPEWLCKQLQDRLYCGQQLFAHSEMLKDGRLHLFPAIHSAELLQKNLAGTLHSILSPLEFTTWTCYSFLLKWCGYPNSLLVMEDRVDASLAFLPFKPMAMKVLQCSFLSGLQLHKSRHLLQILQPKHVLTKEYSEFDISIELACQLKYTTLKRQDVDIAKLKGELLVEQGKYRLLAGNEQVASRPKPKEALRFGGVKLNALLTALRKLGMNPVVEEVVGSGGTHTGSLITVTEPGKAVVEVTGAKTSIASEDENVATLISQAVCSVLDA